MWRRLTRIISREGALPRVSRFLFKAVVQSVLIVCAEIWVVTSRMGRVLGGFQDQVPQRLTGRIPWKQHDIKWEYTSVAESREEAGFKVMKEYIRRRKNRFAQFIATRSILDLCKDTYRTPGGQVGVRWWKQAGIDLIGARERVSAAADKDRG